MPPAGHALVWGLLRCHHAIVAVSWSFVGQVRARCGVTCGGLFWKRSWAKLTDCPATPRPKRGGINTALKGERLSGRFDFVGALAGDVLVTQLYGFCRASPWLWNPGAGESKRNRLDDDCFQHHRPEPRGCLAKVIRNDPWSASPYHRRMQRPMRGSDRVRVVRSVAKLAVFRHLCGCPAGDRKRLSPEANACMYMAHGFCREAADKYCAKRFKKSLLRALPEKWRSECRPTIYFKVHFRQIPSTGRVWKDTWKTRNIS